MSQTKLGSASILSVLIALLAIVASAGGLFASNLYRDNTWTSSQLIGNDVVTLCLAVPLLIGALVLARRGSQRAQLVWMGMLDYVLYTYAFYLFGTAFNVLFLVYVALFTFSILGLIFALPRLDVGGMAHSFSTRTPVKWISGYMIFWAVGLGGLWIAQSLGFVFSGTVPQSIIDSGHPTAIVFALDLSLLIPFIVLGAVWLWQRKPWGYVVSVIVNVKGAVFALALAAMGVSAAQANVPDAMSLVPIWLVFAAASLLCTGFLLGNMRSTK